MQQAFTILWLFYLQSTIELSHKTNQLLKFMSFLGTCNLFDKSNKIRSFNNDDGCQVWNILVTRFGWQAKKGEVQCFGILRVTDSCLSGTIWFKYRVVLSCEIKCQKFVESMSHRLCVTEFWQIWTRQTFDNLFINLGLLG